MRAPRCARLALVTVASAVGAAALPAQTPPDWTTPPPLAAERPFAPPRIERATLSNGLPVLFVARAGVPLIQVNLVLRGGSTEDPAGKFGIASVAADLMRAGAASRPPNELVPAIERLGASLAVRADRQSIQVQLRTTTMGFDSAVAIMSDVALRPTFPDSNVQAYTRRLVTSIARMPEDASNIAAVMLSRAVFGASHPDGQGSLGAGADVASISRADLVAYHASMFHVDRAALIVVGDASLAELMPRLESAFGRGWPAGARAGGGAPPAASSTGRHVWLVDRPGAAQSIVRVVAAMPPRSSPDYFAIEVANMVLGGSTTSRIGKNLRDRHGYTYETRSFVEWRRRTSLFIAYANVETKVTAAALRELMRELTDPKPPTRDELATAKNLLRRSMPQSFMTVGGVADRVGELFLAGLPADAFATYASSVNGVTLAEAVRATRSWLAPARLQIVVVGDRAVIERDLRQLGLGEIEMLSASDVIPPVK